MTATTIALIGTSFALKDFDIVQPGNRGLRLIVPDPYGQELIDRVISRELFLGQVSVSSRKALIDEIGTLGLRGAEVVILCSPEIGTVIDDRNSPLPIIQASALERRAAATELRAA